MTIEAINPKINSVRKRQNSFQSCLLPPLQVCGTRSGSIVRTPYNSMPESKRLVAWSSRESRALAEFSSISAARFGHLAEWRMRGLRESCILRMEAATMSAEWMAISNQLAQATEQAGAHAVAVHSEARGSSSGVVWRPGVIVTAEHALRRDEEIQVTLPGGKVAVAKLDR